jgi:hypothetical protein
MTWPQLAKVLLAQRPARVTRGTWRRLCFTGSRTSVEDFQEFFHEGITPVCVALAHYFFADFSPISSVAGTHRASE